MDLYPAGVTNYSAGITKENRLTKFKFVSRFFYIVAAKLSR